MQGNSRHAITFLDSRIIVPPLLPPPVALSNILKVKPLALMTASATKKHRQLDQLKLRQCTYNVILRFSVYLLMVRFFSVKILIAPPPHPTDLSGLFWVEPEKALLKITGKQACNTQCTYHSLIFIFRNRGIIPFGDVIRRRSAALFLTLGNH